MQTPIFLQILIGNKIFHKIKFVNKIFLSVLIKECFSKFYQGSKTIEQGVRIKDRNDFSTKLLKQI